MFQPRCIGVSMQILKSRQCAEHVILDSTPEPGLERRPQCCPNAVVMVRIAPTHFLKTCEKSPFLQNLFRISVSSVVALQPRCIFELAHSQHPPIFGEWIPQT